MSVIKNEIAKRLSLDQWANWLLILGGSFIIGMSIWSTLPINERLVLGISGGYLGSMGINCLIFEPLVDDLRKEARIAYKGWTESLDREKHLLESFTDVFKTITDLARRKKEDQCKN